MTPVLDAVKHALLYGHSLDMDTFYGQFALSLGKENLDFCSKFNPLYTDTFYCPYQLDLTRPKIIQTGSSYTRQAFEIIVTNNRNVWVVAFQFCKLFQSVSRIKMSSDISRTLISTFRENDSNLISVSNLEVSNKTMDRKQWNPCGSEACDAFIYRR